MLDHDKQKELRRNRRLAKEKKKNKARKIYPHDKDGKLADHLANCSCPMCGNPRRSVYAKGKNKKTLQEIKFEESEDIIC